MRRTLYFYALAASSSEFSPPPGIAVLSHDELVADGPAAAAAIRLAYAGDASYGLLIVKDIPGFSEARRAAMNATIRMARGPPPHSRRSRSTWPGFRSDQDVDDPLQGGFLHNPLEDIGRARVDPVFGKTPWPNADFKSDIVRVNRLIWNVTLAVLAGTDRLVEEEARKAGTAPPQVPLSGLMQQSDFLYFLMKIFRSEFSRGDDLFDDLEHMRSEEGDLMQPDETPSWMPSPRVAASLDASADPQPAAELSSMRTHSASSRASKTASSSTCSAEPAAELSSMRTHSASSRASKTAKSSLSLAEDGASSGEVEPYWLPWHIDPNTISTLTGDAFFDFGAAHTIELPEYPDEGLGLQLLNALGETAYVSKHIDDSSLVIMMAAGAQVHTGGLLRGCMHAVKRQAAPPGASRIMYYQAWYGPSAHKITPPPGSDYHPSRTTAATASNEIGRRVRAVVDPIVNAVYNRTQRTMLLDFRRQFQRLPVGNERDGSQAHFEALNAALPLGPWPVRLTIDMITDLSCPLAYLGLKRLRAALAHLGLDEGAGVRLRFHAVFINPNMEMDGEEMGAYMRKRRNISLEEYNDDSYPLNAAARALKYAYDNTRRVINPRRAHLFVGAAGEEHHARVYEALAERYFEHGDDISDMDTLLALNGELGLLMLERHGSCLNELMMRRAMDRAEGPLMNSYRRLDPLVEGVPHFLVREGVHGSGLELHGPVDIDTFIDALRRVDEARHAPPFGDSFGLRQPAGMVMPGFGGKPIPVPTVDRLGGASISAFNLHGWSGPEAWPYEPSDFSRLDENDDALKYAAPNLGHHIDAPARAALSETYAVFFDSANPRRIGGSELRANLELLDLASSWTSHYPPLPNTTRVAVHGLNAFELGANAIAHRRDVLNLNLHPALPYADGSFDFVTMAASVGYLTRPREVFAEMNRVLKPGGVAIVSFTNRVFDEKATSLWLNNMDEEVALSSIVRNYFYFGPVAGWQNVTSADVSPHPTEGDPMWIVTAVKVSD